MRMRLQRLRMLRPTQSKDEATYLRRSHDVRHHLTWHDGALSQASEQEDTMFGTIGHARIKSGRQAQLDTLNQEWQQTIRPQIPGEVVQLVGHVDGQPDELVFV